ncbi:MAG: PD-(D/E)XK nuclease family protein [Bacillota bacterium]
MRLGRDLTQALHRSLAQQPRPTVLIPHRALLHAWEAAAALAGWRGELGRRVMLLDDLVRDLASRPGTRRIGDNLRRLLVGRLAAELSRQGRLPHIGRLVGRPGLAWSLVERIGELKLAAVPPQGFAEAVRGLGPVLQDLATVYAAWEEFLAAQGLVDREGRYPAALAALRQGADAALAPGEVWVVALPDPTGVQAAIVAELGKGRAVRVIQGEAPPGASRWGTARVETVWAADRARETDLAVRRTKRLLLEEGLSPGDVALVARDPAAYQELLARGLGEASVPLALARSESLARSPLAASALRLLRAATQPCDISVMARDRYLFGGAAAPLANLAALRGETRPAAEWLARAAARPRASPEWDEACRAWEACVQALAQFPQGGRSAQLADTLGSCVRELGVAERAAAQSGDMSALARLEELLADYALAERLMPEAAPRSLGAFAAELEACLAETDWGLGGSAVDGVALCEPVALRGLAPEAVLVLGMVEGAFPREIRLDWLLTSGARAVLRDLGLALPTLDDLRRREALLWEGVRSAASCLCYLSCPVTDADGSPELPSRFWLEAGGAGEAGTPSLPRGRVSPGWQEACGTFALQTALAREWHRPRTTAGPQAWPVQAEALLAALPWHGAVPREWGAAVALGAPGLQDERLRAEYADRPRLSPSALGAYLRCPFRYFCQYVLKLQPRQNLEDDLGALDLGRVYHAVLRQALLPWLGGPFPSDCGELLGSLEEACRQATLPDQLAPEAAVAFRRRMARRLAPLLREEAARAGRCQGRLRLAALELGFGVERPEGGLDPASTPGRFIVAGPWGSRLGGVIDRVDTAGDGCVLYDYKTGGLPDNKDIEAGLDLQLALYAAAVNRLFPQFGPVLGVTYLSAGRADKPRGVWRGLAGKTLAGGGVRKLFLDDAGWAEWLDRSIARVRAVAAGVAAGSFPAQPREEQACRSCDYSGVCRRGWGGGEAADVE